MKGLFRDKSVTISADIQARNSPTYSARGLRTNSRSTMPRCGRVSRSWSRMTSPYRSISKSILRGPLSMIFFRPIDFSIACNSSKRAIGSKDVSTYKAPCQSLEKSFSVVSPAFIYLYWKGKLLILVCSLNRRQSSEEVQHIQNADDKKKIDQPHRHHLRKCFGPEHT